MSSSGQQQATQQKPVERKQIEASEVEKHNKKGDLWVVIDSLIYDVSKFAALHPGGENVLSDPEVAGQDATEVFFGLHKYEILQKPQYKRLIIGQVKGEEEQIVPPPPGAPSKVPYAEPTWLQDKFHTPYFQEHHRHLQREMRKYVDERVRDVALRCEANGKRPDVELVQEMGKNGLNAMRMGPGKHLQGRKLFADIKPEQFDYFCEMIITQELVRMGSRGFGDGLQGGMVIGLPPIMNFGSDEIKKEIVEPVLAGEKYICLAITEAFAGSDIVGGLKTYAKKSADGSYYTVTGTKKWITNGMFADYFTTACKTDEGFAVLCIPRSVGDIETKQIKTSYSTTAGTAYVIFDECKVPAKYLIGEDGAGIPVILSNFNHERWVMCCSTIRSARAICAQTMMWTNQRKAFGKPIISQPVVRQTLAGLISQCEAAQAWLENVTFQMNKMSYYDQSTHLAGQIALLKSWSTRVSHEVADQAVNLWGGRGISVTGMGADIAAFHRTYKFDAVLGGSEHILADLGVRQALRNYPTNEKL